jgi:hypothetical protein
MHRDAPVVYQPFDLLAQMATFNDIAGIRPFILKHSSAYIQNQTGEKYDKRGANALAWGKRLFSNQFAAKSTFEMVADR